MGGCLHSGVTKFTPKQYDKFKKVMDDRIDQSRYEDGHSYSGEIGMVNYFVRLSNVFHTHEAFLEYAEKVENTNKDTLYVVEVKDVHDNKTMSELSKKIMKLDDGIFFGKVKNKDGVWKVLTEKQLATYHKKRQELRLKLREKRQALGEKRKTTRLGYFAWCSS